MRFLLGILLSTTASLACASSTNAMLTLTVDGSSSGVNSIQSINLKKTLVCLVVPKGEKAEITQKWLRALRYRAGYYKVVSGIEVDATDVLDSKSLKAIAYIAGKSTFVSTKFTLQSSKDWKSLFSQERSNPYLMTTVYGPNAVAQLQDNPSLAAAFSDSHVPFVHVFASTQSKSPDSILKFWQEVAQTSKNNQHPIAYMLLANGHSRSVNYAQVVSDSVKQSAGYIQWVGGDDTTRFQSIAPTAKALTVWRLSPEDKVKGYAYARTTSPMGLYNMMGMSQQVFNILAPLAWRTQLGANAGVTFLGDAEDNVHTEGVLVSLAGTAVVENSRVLLPQQVKGHALSQFNLLINGMSNRAVDELFTNAVVIHLLQHTKKLGIFDYSQEVNPRFYSALHTVLKDNKGFLLTYNSATRDGVVLLRKSLRHTAVKQVILGAAAKRHVTSKRESNS